jgi:hypothetical protein
MPPLSLTRFIGGLLFLTYMILTDVFPSTAHLVLVRFVAGVLLLLFVAGLFIGDRRTEPDPKSAPLKLIYFLRMFTYVMFSVVIIGFLFSILHWPFFFFRGWLYLWVSGFTIWTLLLHIYRKRSVPYSPDILDAEDESG